MIAPDEVTPNTFKSGITDLIPLITSSFILLQLLLNLSSRIPTEVASNVLCNKLWASYKEHDNLQWLTELIKHNSVPALKEYYIKAQAAMTLPDMLDPPCVPETTEAIENINAYDCLSLLVELFMLSHNPKFVDREFLGLKSSCWKAIIAIGRKHYKDTYDMLLSVQENCPAYLKYSLSDLSHALEDEQHKELDIPMDFESAIILTHL